MYQHRQSPEYVPDITAIAAPARELIHQEESVVGVFKQAMVCESGSSLSERPPIVSGRLLKLKVQLHLGVDHC